LRNNWTELALDFYVLVKAHIARLAQSIQLFSGDPAMSLRCAVLLQSFERAIQVPAVEATPARSSARKAAGHKRAAKRALVAKKKPIRPLKITKRAKPLVRKIKLTGRRAQR
jgi:hypothetical protein